MSALPQPTVLIVDDHPQNLDLLVDLLGERYRLKVATRGEVALRLAAEAPQPDLVLLDVMMPGMDGHAVCRRLKADPATAAIPVVFVTARGSVEDEAQGLALGAVDYITKPVSPPIVLARVQAQLALKAATDALRERGHTLEAEVQRRSAEVSALQDVTVLALASLGETRDNETGNHLRRTQHYIVRLAEALREDPRHAGALPDEELVMLYKSAPLHDIGKVGIPDRILLKPARLTPEEFETMKTHTTLGHDALVRAERQIGREVGFLRCAKAIALSHHERWDGSGYPQGLAGEAIPLAARLMAVADVYDAMISRRAYKPAGACEAAEAVILDGSGSHFDPAVVAAFERVRPDFQAIAERFADAPPAADGAAAPGR